MIDPKHTIEEMHTDNNKAYARLPVRPPTDPISPMSLSISTDDIAFNPEMPAAGDLVQIAATVHADGNTFTHVGVDFWDDDPVHGGRFIGGQMIPMILAGQTSTADIG